MKKKFIVLIVVFLLIVPLAVAAFLFLPIRLVPLNSVPVYNGVWNLQPRMERILAGGSEQGITDNAFQILNFDPDDPITSTVYATSAVGTATFTTSGTKPALSSSIGDVVFDENTPTGKTSVGYEPAWYRFHFTVETNGKWIYATPERGTAAEKYHSLLFPVAEWDEVTASIYFTVTLAPTLLFTEEYDAHFEKVRIEEVKTGISTRVGWDWAQIENFVEDWAPGSIAPSVDFFTAAGANVIDSTEDVEGGQTAHCHMSLDMRTGYEASPGAGNPILTQVTDAAEWTPHNVYAEVTLVAQLLINYEEGDDDGQPPPAVPWWESLLNIIQDLQTRVQTLWEDLNDLLGPLLIVIVVGIFVLIAICIIVRRKR